jgi:CBS domain containing-hemolysin-like protein
MNPVAVAAALALVVLNGFFVAVEFAFTAARRGKIEELAVSGQRRARAALAAMNELPLTFAAAQLGIAAASLALGYVAEPAVATGLERALRLTPIPSGLAHSIALAVGLLIIVLLHNIFGEMTPKNAAIADPERTALWLAIPFRAYVGLFRPIISVITGVANQLLRILRVQPVQRLEAGRSAEDIAAMVRAVGKEGLVSGLPHRLLTGAISFSDRSVSEVMVPRPDVVAIPIDITPAEAETKVLEEGFSRLAVYRKDLDDVVGFIHAKDLLSVRPTDRHRPLAAELVRPLLSVPESARVGPLLTEMRRARNHMALVVDEHGGTAGLVTLEDLAEELVGDIRDEHEEGEFDVRTIGENWYLVSGSVRPDQLAESLGLGLPEGEYETLGGFVMDSLGRIPHQGDRVEHEGWTMRVRRMEGRRVDEVELIARSVRSTP